MPNKVIPIGPGTRVTLKFSLHLEDGHLIDSTGETPATFDVGDDTLLPGFERSIYGMKPGNKSELKIPPDKGFGVPNPENIHMMKRSLFADLDLKEGVVVSFADNDGLERPGVINRILGDALEVDFNHPLAGKDVVLKVEIVDVQRVSDDIIRG